MKAKISVQNIRTQIFDAINGTEGYLQQNDLVARFHADGLTTTRAVRAVIEELNSDPTDPRLIASCNLGYYIPRTEADVDEFNKRFDEQRAARAATSAHRAAVQYGKTDALKAAIRAKH